MRQRTPRGRRPRLPPNWPVSSIHQANGGSLTGLPRRLGSHRQINQVETQAGSSASSRMNGGRFQVAECASLQGLGGPGVILNPLQGDGADLDQALQGVPLGSKLGHPLPELFPLLMRLPEVTVVVEIEGVAVIGVVRRDRLPEGRPLDLDVVTGPRRPGVWPPARDVGRLRKRSLGRVAGRRRMVAQSLTSGVARIATSSNSRWSAR